MHIYIYIDIDRYITAIMYACKYGCLKCQEQTARDGQEFHLGQPDGRSPHKPVTMELSTNRVPLRFPKDL